LASLHLRVIPVGATSGLLAVNDERVARAGAGHSPASMSCAIALHPSSTLGAQYRTEPAGTTTTRWIKPRSPISLS
jgi:hypothetical protein